MSDKEQTPPKRIPIVNPDDDSLGQNPDWPGDRKPITPENEPPDTKVPLVR